jgi:glycosyltransferase involved in cell wall biosynthesis
MHAYHFFNPGVEHVFGGAELQLHLLATQLAKDPEIEVSFIVGDFGQPRQEKLQGVTLYTFNDSVGGARYTRTPRYYGRLFGLLRKADSHVYIQRTAGHLTFIIALFCKIFRRKFVYMVAHDEDLGTVPPSWYGQGPRAEFSWRLFMRGVGMADRVIVQHERQKEELARVHGKEGVIRPSAHPMPEGGSGQERSFFLWVARSEPWKQPEVYLDLARAYPGEEFVMVCPPSQEKALFETIRRKAGDLANVRFLEYVPYREIPSYFRRARAFVNTSRKEGFPNTFIEAAREGTPVLSLTVDPDGILGEHRFGKTFGGDVSALSEALGRVKEDDEEWEKLSRNARAYALGHHDLSRIVEEDKRLIEALAAGVVAGPDRKTRLP